MFESFFSFESKAKIFLIFNFLFLNFIFDISKAENNNFVPNSQNQIKVDYLKPRNELENYILDTGDIINLVFFPAIKFSGFYSVNEEGEIILPELEETYVRGLTPLELKNLLEEKYDEYLVEPEIKARIAVFKGLRIFVQGEVRNPGLYKFPPYISSNFKSQNFFQLEKLFNPELLKPQKINEPVFNNPLNNPLNLRLNYPEKVSILERDHRNITTITKAIREAGGITSFTDLSRIEVIRDIPQGKGGGKKIAIVDLKSYIYEEDTKNDLRLFDGDRIFFPKLSSKSVDQIPRSILSGISPRFINVNISGRIENSGIVKLPLEAVLSDAIDVTGPRKPLSGKIVLIRYNKDGSILKKKISYSAEAKRGSKRNPFLKENDIISVQNSLFGKSSDFITEVTRPFLGIYAAQELLENFNDD